MAKYLMRFDDINSKMDWDKFCKIKIILEKYNIKSILGVIPICRDQNLLISKEYKDYYNYLRRCKSYGDNIAQHGFEHVYDSNRKGIYGSSKNSEFAGHSLKKQIEKLNKGKLILQKESIWEPIFMAPSHSFDLNTLIALRKLNFNIVLDGFSISPFTKEKLIFIPQISSRPLPFNFPGIFQLCIHINSISPKELEKLASFIELNHTSFTAINKIKLRSKLLQLFDKSIMYLIIKIFRFIRKLIYHLLFIFKKIRCLHQRTIYKFKLRNIDLYNWHLSGTFYCRNYKSMVLEIINNLKPSFYIDIGCGLGEILARVNLRPNLKFGYDLDNRLEKAIEIINKEKFRFFTNELQMINDAKKFQNKKNQKLVISILNFAHNLSQNELNQIINKYYKSLGKYILIIDNIYVKEKKYKYDHHNLLYNHNGLIKYCHKVDKLRSLYCIQIG